MIGSRTPSILAYFVNPARLCKRVSLPLPLSYYFALCISCCFLAYAMANYVLPMPPRPCGTCIFRPSCRFEGSRERSICSISVSRLTNFSETGRPMRQDYTGKSSCPIARRSIRTPHYLNHTACEKSSTLRNPQQKHNLGEI